MTTLEVIRQRAQRTAHIARIRGSSSICVDTAFSAFDGNVSLRTLASPDTTMVEYARQCGLNCIGSFPVIKPITGDNIRTLLNYPARVIRATAGTASPVKNRSIIGILVTTFTSDGDHDHSIGVVRPALLDRPQRRQLQRKQLCVVANSHREPVVGIVSAQKIADMVNVSLQDNIQVKFVLIGKK